MEMISQVPRLPPRAPEGHKGTYGSVLIVAGSVGMSGAAILCGSAALRSGAGLVRLAIPETIQAIVAAANPCYMTIGLAGDKVTGQWPFRWIPELLSWCQQSDAIAVGPGWGTGGNQTAILAELVRQLQPPLVVDADGLNALVELPPDLLQQRKSPTILTPHPGEFARLTARSTQEIQAHRLDYAIAYAAAMNVILVLKGHQTIVTDGRRIYRNTSGNPGMATGGSGDVLTGVVASLLASGMDPFEATILAVYIHGLAGDLGCAEFGETALIASDLLSFLPRAFMTHAQ